MAYILPTNANKVLFASSSESVGAGSVSISLTIKNATSFVGSSYVINVINIGSIEVDYNYIKDVGDINDFKVNLPKIEFSVLDAVRLPDGSGEESLVNLISSLSASDVIIVELTFDGSSSYYYCTRDNCEFSFSSRQVKISAIHPIKFGLLPLGTTWGASYFTGKTVVVDYGGGSLTNSVLPRDLIEGYLSRLGDSVSIHYSSVLHQETYTDTFSDNQVVLLPSEYISGTTVFDDAPNDFEVATTRVKQHALSECAIVGNVLGYGFYVPRFDKTLSNKSQLSADDFLSLDMDTKFKNVRFYTFEAEHTSVVSVQIVNQAISSTGSVDVSVNFPYPTYQATASWSVADSEFERPGIYSYPVGFEDDLKVAFKKVFRVADSGLSIDPGVYISGTITGVSKLKPYQFFNVSSGAHPLVDGKDFRPSYLKYDLVNDTIEFEAYEF